MKRKSRGILFIGDKLTLIKRNTEHSTYYVLPGGSVEEGEDFELALIREFKEELGIDVRFKKRICEIIDHTTNIHESFFEVEKMDGEVGTGTDIKFSSDSQRKNEYQILFMDMDSLQELHLLPLTVRDIIIKFYARTS